MPESQREELRKQLTIENRDLGEVIVQSISLRAKHPEMVRAFGDAIRDAEAHPGPSDRAGNPDYVATLSKNPRSVLNPWLVAEYWLKGVDKPSIRASCGALVRRGDPADPDGTVVIARAALAAQEPELFFPTVNVVVASIAGVPSAEIGAEFMVAYTKYRESGASDSTGARHALLALTQLGPGRCAPIARRVRDWERPRFERLAVRPWSDTDPLVDADRHGAEIARLEAEASRRGLVIDQAEKQRLQSLQNEAFQRFERKSLWETIEKLADQPVDGGAQPLIKPKRDERP